jgi:hypothetical protein
LNCVERDLQIAAVGAKGFLCGCHAPGNDKIAQGVK